MPRRQPAQGRVGRDVRAARSRRARPVPRVREDPVEGRGGSSSWCAGSRVSRDVARKLASDNCMVAARGDATDAALRGSLFSALYRSEFGTEPEPFVWRRAPTSRPKPRASPPTMRAPTSLRAASPSAWSAPTRRWRGRRRGGTRERRGRCGGAGAAPVIGGCLPAGRTPEPSQDDASGLLAELLSACRAGRLRDGGMSRAARHDRARRAKDDGVERCPSSPSTASRSKCRRAPPSAGLRDAGAKSRASATTSGCRSPATAGCAWSRSEGPQAGGVVRAARGRGAGDLTTRTDGEEGARRGDGVPPDQPPARLPDLRPGRRVRPAGPGDGLWPSTPPAMHENKRAVDDKYIGPLIKTVDDRCIHCTRCVRFSTKSGAPEDGRDRPRRGHADHHLSRAGVTSELQGNVIDLCPVGALTSKPYAFAARPWELTKTQSIDVMDARRLEHPGRRPRPRGDAHPAAHQRRRERGVDLRQDAPRRRRAAHAAARPAVYPRANGKLRAATWHEAFAAIAAETSRTDGKRIGAVAGDLAAVEEMFALKELLAEVRLANLAVQGGEAFDARAAAPPTSSIRPSPASSRPMRSLIVGSNPRKEALAAQRAHPQALAHRAASRIGVIGDKADLDLRLRPSRRRHGTR